MPQVFPTSGVISIVIGSHWHCDACGSGIGFTVRSFTAQLWSHWWSRHRLMAA